MQRFLLIPAVICVNVPVIPDDKWAGTKGIYLREGFALAGGASCTVNITNNIKKKNTLTVQWQAASSMQADH